MRAAAASALRFMPGEDVLETLLDVIKSDPEPVVRINAIQAAGERAPDRALLEAVFDASLGDASKGVRDQATDTLNRWGANYPPIGEARSRRSSGRMSPRSVRRKPRSRAPCRCDDAIQAGSIVVEP